MTLLTRQELEHLIERETATLDKLTGEIGVRLLLGDPLGYALLSREGKVLDMAVDLKALSKSVSHGGCVYVKLFGVVIDGNERD